MIKPYSENYIAKIKYDLNSPEEHFSALIATFLMSLIPLVASYYAYRGFLEYGYSTDSIIPKVVYWINNVLIFINCSIIIVVFNSKRSYKFQKTLALMTYIYMSKMAIDLYIAYFAMLLSYYYYDGTDVSTMMIIGLTFMTCGIILTFYYFHRASKIIKRGDLKEESDLKANAIDFENTKAIIIVQLVVMPTLGSMVYVLRAAQLTNIYPMLVLMVASIIQYVMAGKLPLIFFRSYCILNFESCKMQYYPFKVSKKKKLETYEKKKIIELKKINEAKKKYKHDLRKNKMIKR